MSSPPSLYLSIYLAQISFLLHFLFIYLSLYQLSPFMFLSFLSLLPFTPVSRSLPNAHNILLFMASFIIPISLFVPLLCPHSLLPPPHPSPHLVILSPSSLLFLLIFHFHFSLLPPSAPAPPLIHVYTVYVYIHTHSIHAGKKFLVSHTDQHHFQNTTACCQLPDPTLVRNW